MRRTDVAGARAQAEGGSVTDAESKEIPHLFAPGRLLYLRQTSGAQEFAKS